MENSCTSPSPSHRNSDHHPQHHSLNQTYSSSIGGVLRNLSPDSLAKDLFNVELSNIRPIFIIRAAVLLHVTVGNDLIPKGIPLRSFYVAYGKAVVEGGGENNHNEIFIRVVMLQVETFEIAVTPFVLVAGLFWIVL